MIKWIFRSKKRNEFSIENVFHNIKPNVIKHGISVEEIFLPYEHYNSLKSLIGNLLFSKKLKADIIHVTGEVHFIVPVLRNVPTVLTIHDLVVYELSTGLKRWLYKYFWIYLPIKYSSTTMCISEKTRRDIISLYPKFENKLSVVPDAYNPEFNLSPKTFDFKCPTILAMGTRSNKNLERIIEAIDGIECKLDIVGKLSAEQELLLKDHKTNYMNYVGLTNQQIYERYCKCDLLCFPSLYEGFGMPIIEAQAVGRPVVTSNISPMCDVAGDGAILVDPYSSEDIRRGITDIIDDDECIQDLITKGLSNASLYSPEHVAEMYCCIYEKLYKK